MNSYIRIETVKILGKWYVRVIDSYGYDLHPGARLRNMDGSVFFNDLTDRESEFASRRLARKAIRSYKIRLHGIKLIGGLH